MAASVTGMPLNAGGRPGRSAGADALVVQIWDRNGVEVYLSQPQRRLPQYGQLGFNTVATDSGEWRVFSTLAGDQVVQVAQPMSARRELGREHGAAHDPAAARGRAVPRACSSGSASPAAWRRSSASPWPSAGARRDRSRRWPSPDCRARCSRWCTR